MLQLVAVMMVIALVGDAYHTANGDIVVLTFRIFPY